jgi:hypothetical protein
MMEGCRTDHCPVHFKGAMAQFLQIRDFGFEVCKFDREKTIPHLVVEGVLETVHARMVAVDLQMGRALVKRAEVRKAEHVIPVDVGDEKVNVEGFALGQQLVTERPYPGSGINDDNAPALQGDLETRSVSAIKNGVSARNSNGATGAPKLDSHSAFPGTTRFRLLWSRQPAENVFKFKVIAV